MIAKCDYLTNHMSSDSVADLCDTSVLIYQALPTYNRKDDTPLDIDVWAKTHA